MIDDEVQELSAWQEKYHFDGRMRTQHRKNSLDSYHRSKGRDPKNPGVATRSRASEPQLLRPGRPKLAKMNSLLGVLRAVAKNRCSRTGVECTITIEEVQLLYLEQGGICPLTGVAFESTGPRHLKPSLDRIDGSKGYVPGNVRIVTQWANYARNAYGDEVFIMMCSMVTAHVSHK